jgi:hypothetical protein
LPHFWVERGGKRVSILDVIGQKTWTLISASEEWETVLLGVNERSQNTIRSVRVDDQLKGFQQAFSVCETGAALIRPDGYIAWRSNRMPSNAVDVLREVLGQVAFEVGFTE